MNYIPSSADPSRSSEAAAKKINRYSYNTVFKDEYILQFCPRINVQIQSLSYNKFNGILKFSILVKAICYSFLV